MLSMVYLVLIYALIYTLGEFVSRRIGLPHSVTFAGLAVFLLTDCLINREGKDITPYPQGDFDALMGFVQSWA